MGLLAIGAVAGIASGGLSHFLQKGAMDDVANAQAMRTAKQLEIEKRKRLDLYGVSQSRINDIKKRAIVMRGRQIAQQATSGALVGSGSTQAMVDETFALAQMDALIEMKNLEKQVEASRERSELIRLGAEVENASMKQQRKANLLGSISTGLGVFSSVMSLGKSPIGGGGGAGYGGGSGGSLDIGFNPTASEFMRGF